VHEASAKVLSVGYQERQLTCKLSTSKPSGLYERVGHSVTHPVGQCGQLHLPMSQRQTSNPPNCGMKNRASMKVVVMMMMMMNE